ncbi:four helix bundle protein [Paludibacter sp. 221]|uniref:four helix bundle protein n=1 Tax=Paludibacter sp. 221 TaxID=2302939 RepID=UPI0013D28079|nr:four helix bundle protein [Paludibacter sp. 221]NDV47519.1 four helix bundle protein [Paludibacter sp. 221]
METTNSFTDLRMWQKSHDFVLEVYKITELFPKQELWGLVSQVRRASVSIPANIAEGYKRKGKVDKLRFFNISQSSLEECRYYLILSKDLNYISEEQYLQLNNKLEEASKSLNSYCKKLYGDVQNT